MATRHQTEAQLDQVRAKIASQRLDPCECLTVIMALLIAWSFFLDLFGKDILRWTVLFDYYIFLVEWTDNAINWITFGYFEYFMEYAFTIIFDSIQSIADFCDLLRFQ